MRTSKEWKNIERKSSFRMFYVNIYLRYVYGKSVEDARN